MEESSIPTPEEDTPPPDAARPDAASLKASLPDDVSVRRWFAAYALFVVACALPLVLLALGQEWSWRTWRYEFLDTFASTGAGVKLLFLVIYLSFCCTFLPLPTGWLVAVVAMQQTSVADSLPETVLLVGLVGAAGSTIANLNDYHLFTWMLRHHRIAAIRTTRIYRLGSAWFGRSPFVILVAFNIIPIPVDVIRMLAATNRYPRVPFAAANFVGRFVRYAIIAAVTYLLGEKGYIAVAALLVLAVVLGAIRLLPALARKLVSRKPDAERVEVSHTIGRTKE